MDPAARALSHGDATTIGDDIDAEKQAVGGRDPAPALDPHAVKRLKLKADLILLPLLTVAYLFK